MSVEISFDLSGITKKFSPDAIERAQELLAERVLKDSNKYCMRDSGATMDEAFFTEDSVEWPTEYAQYAYNADHALKNKNPQATPQWFETAKQNHLKEWEQYVKEELT